MHDIKIPEEVLEEYFRLRARADNYLNEYIRRYRIKNDYGIRD